MAIEREASLLLRGEDKGVSKLLSSVTKSTINLSKGVEETSSNFVDLGTSLPNKSLQTFGKTSRKTIGSVTGLNRSMRGVGSNYANVIDKTEQANKALEVSDNLFVKLSANAFGFGNKLETINTVLEPASGFWQDYSRSSTGAGKALRGS